MFQRNFISGGGQLGSGHCDWIVVSAENNYKFEGTFKFPINSEFANILIEFYWFTESEVFISADTFTIPTNTITRDTWTRFEHFASAPLDRFQLIYTNLCCFCWF